MSVQFEDNQYRSAVPASSHRGLIGFVIRAGLARDGKSARVVLLVIAALAAAGAIAFPFFVGNAPSTTVPTDIDITLEQPVP